MRCILNMKMKKTDYIRILSLLLAASVLMGGCSSRSAQQSAQTSQPVQQETQVEEEPSETSEQDQQQEQEQEPQETSEEDQQQNDSAQEEAPPQDEAQSGEEVYGFDPTLSAYAGQDGNGHFAAETIEGLIMEHFDVTPEQIRAENDAYSEEFGTYIEPQGLGGYTPGFGISGADREGNTLVLAVEHYTDRKQIFHTPERRI